MTVPTIATATMTSKGQITVPKEVRDKLGVRPGDHVEFIESDRGFLVQKRIEPSAFDQWVGHLQVRGRHDADGLVEEMRGR